MAYQALVHRLTPSPSGAGGVPPQGQAAGAEVPPTVDPGSARRETTGG